ncbi:peptidylprolyl isomerase [Winogradskyella sp. A2]|uniref:peptidylprolyl isomerase n=1 Tax=Winogradskyella sp. A2 TaxID=3366944 RepID=UPI00398C4896
MKQLLTVFFILPLICIAQDNFNKELDSILSKEDAKIFIKSNKSIKGKIIVFNKEKHKTQLAEDLFKLSKGGKKVVNTEYNNTYYKILDKKKIPHNRVSYVFFDGKKMTASEINSKRVKIMALYKNGYKFKDMAKLYSMDINASRGGDSGWFEDGKMHTDFENAVKYHSTEDIFTLDINELNWHYVILKTHDAKKIEEITVLRFSETKV